MQHSTASRGTVFSWTLFDFANTGFYVIIVTFVFPIYFKNVIAGGNEAYWGRTIAASMLLTAVFGPLLGSIADATNRKKLFLGIFTGACVAATAGLYVTGAGTLVLAVILLIIANMGFEGGTIFYDALLPEISSEEYYARISGYGFAMGYLGSIAIILIVRPILAAADAAGSLDALRPTFLVAAAFFGLFAIPLFLAIKEQPGAGGGDGASLIAGYRRLRETFTHLRQYRSIMRFMLAFFIYNDSILTVILFAGIFAEQTLRMSTSELVYFFLIVQASALVGSLLFGAITNRIGARQVIVITLVIWIGVVVWAYLIETKSAFYWVGAVAGIGLGSSQSTSRAMMALLTPFEKKTEFFGFYDGFFGKASAIMGPLVFGEVSAAFGQRPAMLVLGGMFLLGILLMTRVPDVRPGQLTMDNG